MSKTKSVVVAFLLCIVQLGFAQEKESKYQKFVKKQFNWYNLDKKTNKAAGVGTEKAYSELLKGKTSKTIVVAVIDGGVDVNHEDLKSVIWNNAGEIAGNGIDDDKNGFVDDVHGWNFLGNAKMENVRYASLELTREYKKLNPKYEGKTLKDIPTSDTSDYAYFQRIKKEYDKEKEKAEKSYNQIAKFNDNFNFVDSISCLIFKKKDYTLADIKAMQAEKGSPLFELKEYLLSLYGKGFNKEEYIEYRDQVFAKYKKQINTDYNPRTIIGDDIDNGNDTNYGNNDVAGPDPSHGTAVAGIIAANRTNNLGMLGVADNVQIMVLRVVPDGDEYDKDVANAIRYAAANGAKILNCSFGKQYSPNKKMVDDAILFAQSKGVLIVHAAGNDGVNNDLITHYPANLDAKNNAIITNWIDVGASAMKDNKRFPAVFSNYGKKTVDVFAPGVDIYTTFPGNDYKIKSGTSFSAPVVSGVAALIWSYYPNFSAQDIKKIIIESVVKYNKKKVILPNLESKKKTKVRFGELCVTAGVVNVYNALQLAEKMSKK